MVEEENNKVKTLTEDISLLESYIQDLFSFTPLPLCFVNPKGMVLEVNPAFVKTTGYDEYDVVGESLSSFMKEEDAKSILKEAIEVGIVEGKEVGLKVKGGEDLPVTAFAKSRKVKGEGVNGAFLSFFDLTEIKEKEFEVEKTNKKLEEKLEEMEKINKLTIGRELKMVELKEKMEKMEKELKKYKKEG